MGLCISEEIYSILRNLDGKCLVCGSKIPWLYSYPPKIMERWFCGKDRPNVYRSGPPKELILETLYKDPNVNRRIDILEMSEKKIYEQFSAAIDHLYEEFKTRHKCTECRDYGNISDGEILCPEHLASRERAKEEKIRERIRESEEAEKRIEDRKASRRDERKIVLESHKIPLEKT